VVDINKTGALSIGLEAMTCTNRCRHCWIQGNPTHRSMPVEQVYYVLERLAEVKQYMAPGLFVMYDEPTTHPQFIEIIEKAAQLGLIGEDFFLPTNGSILARAPEHTWDRLKRAGMNSLQLTIYGLEQTHDDFAGRRGAFKDIITTIRRAVMHDIEWWCGVVLHPGNIGELDDTVAYLKRLDPEGKAAVGWFLFFWQGRGRDINRVRANDFARLPEHLRKGSHWVDESEAIRRIIENPNLSRRRPSEPYCQSLWFQVDRDLQVYCGGSCDCGGIAAAIPEMKAVFSLGKLTDAGFLPLIESYQQKPPAVIQYLDNITWGELAKKYGDPTNDEFYYLNDLPEQKWAAKYLSDGFKIDLG
jgi:MoaA/NifB/PqqE/SkfB family radical SAM enzyme